MRAAAVTLLLVLGGCGIPEHGPMMEPGEDCLSCHGPGSAKPWTAAGTVFSGPEANRNEGIQGVEVQITDSKNRVVTVTSNGAGNFYTAETLFYPISVEIRRGKSVMMMPDNADNHGACNHCHNGGSGPDDMGRIYLP